MATFQESVAARNARLNALNTELSTGAILKLFSGALPANCAAADPSGTLCTITLTGSAFASASSGAMAMTGTWAGTGSASGTAACFRLYDSGGTTCHQQGDAGTSGTAMVLTNASIANGQAVSVTTYTITAGNA
jgi:hypothetical protein